MATRAQRFRYDAERSGPNKKAAPKRDHSRRETDDVGARNLSHRGDRKGQVATEESHAKPSRKSTRPSANHGKNSAMKERVAKQKLATPQVKHEARNRRAR